MAINNIAFRNLRAEMGRRQITIRNIADTIGMNRDTLSRKLSRNSPLNLNEAFEITDKCFPDMTVEVLFAEAREEERVG